MGLGLSIAKKIVDAHHGQILVRNVADCNESDAAEGGATGACFTVIIPRDLKTPGMRRQSWLEEKVND
jgi:signal transduction histidine kinase